jgi:hypothetical protein
MTIQNIIDQYKIDNTLTDEQVSIVLADLRTDAVNYLQTNPNRKFAIALLDNVIDKRKNSEEEGNGDNIMFACYLLGIHGQLEDSLLIWQAKNTDFDSYAYVDIQLVVFAGVDKTLRYLDSLKTEESTKAIKYIKDCSDAGDFDELENYFSKEELPWWI